MALQKKMHFGGVLACFVCFFVSFGATGDDRTIETFIIPHSHMDVGWVYTIQVGLNPSERASAWFFSPLYPANVTV